MSIIIRMSFDVLSYHPPPPGIEPNMNAVGKTSGRDVKTFKDTNYAPNLKLRSDSCKKRTFQFDLNRTHLEIFEL